MLTLHQTLTTISIKVGVFGVQFTVGDYRRKERRQRAQTEAKVSGAVNTVTAANIQHKLASSHIVTFTSR